MKTLIKKLAGNRVKGQSGFTLVELLVVVAIIVALAAVIIPNVVAFAGKGEQGGMAGEMDSVQTAVDALMADKGLTAVTANAAPANGTQDFSAATGTDFDPNAATTAYLEPYLRKNTTNYFYCWDAAGLITAQQKTAAACP